MKRTMKPILSKKYHTIRMPLMNGHQTIVNDPKT